MGERSSHTTTTILNGFCQANGLYLSRYGTFEEPSLECSSFHFPERDEPSARDSDVLLREESGKWCWAHRQSRYPHGSVYKGRGGLVQLEYLSFPPLSTHSPLLSLLIRYRFLSSHVTCTSPSDFRSRFCSVYNPSIVPKMPVLCSMSFHCFEASFWVRFSLFSSYLLTTITIYPYLLILDHIRSSEHAIAECHITRVDRGRLRSHFVCHHHHRRL